MLVWCEVQLRILQQSVGKNSKAELKWVNNTGHIQVVQALNIGFCLPYSTLNIIDLKSYDDSILNIHEHYPVWHL